MSSPTSGICRIDKPSRRVGVYSVGKPHHAGGNQTENSVDGMGPSSFQGALDGLAIVQCVRKPDVAKIEIDESVRYIEAVHETDTDQ
jgi:hypothetical protein